MTAASLSLAAASLAIAGGALAQEVDAPTDQALPSVQQAMPASPAPAAQPAPPPASPPPPPVAAPQAQQAVEERVTPQGYIRVEPGQPAEDQPAVETDDDDEVPGSEGYAGPDDQETPDGADDVDFETFHDALAPYGNWVYTAEYGWVWQPSGESADWVPYSDGEWDWTAYGWTWCGAEPWAWAPYHYGRWASLNGLGWGWVPGYTWGPAWVAWRSGAGHVGWTPLWPGWSYGRWGGWPINYAHWNFTPLDHFYGGRVDRALARGGAVAGLWGVTSFASTFRYNGASFVGPNPGLVASTTGHPVTPLAIHPLTSVAQAGLAGRRGNALNVLAPAFYGAAHPFAVNGRVANVAATAVIGNRVSEAAAARGTGITPYRGELSEAAGRGFGSGSTASAGTFSTYHAPSISNGYGSYAAVQEPAHSGYGSSYQAPRSSGDGYRGGYSPSYRGGYSGYAGGSRYGGYSGGYHAAPSYRPSYGGHASRPSYGGAYGGGGRGGGGSRGGGGRR